MNSELFSQDPAREQMRLLNGSLVTAPSDNVFDLQELAKQQVIDRGEVMLRLNTLTMMAADSITQTATHISHKHNETIAEINRINTETAAQIDAHNNELRDVSIELNSLVSYLIKQADKTRNDIQKTLNESLQNILHEQRTIVSRTMASSVGKLNGEIEKLVSNAVAVSMERFRKNALALLAEANNMKAQANEALENSRKNAAKAENFRSEVWREIGERVVELDWSERFIFFLYCMLRPQDLNSLYLIQIPKSKQREAIS